MADDMPAGLHDALVWSLQTLVLALTGEKGHERLSLPLGCCGGYRVIFWASANDGCALDYWQHTLECESAPDRHEGHPSGA